MATKPITVSVKFSLSTKKDKKLMAVFYRDGVKIKTTHFGATGYSDYTLHKDVKRKQRYMNRHRNKEDWNNPFTAGALSYWILWNKPTIQKSITAFKKRFHLK